MKTLQFNNGDQMPVLGLGTWKSEPGEVYKAVKEALRVGYRHIDCAPIYGNEAEIGRALSESFQEGIVSRNQVWITSKLWNNAHAPEDVEPALKKTLADLQLDYLDLFLIHWPIATKTVIPASPADQISTDVLPISKTWGAMEAMVDKGLCRHIGVCNFSLSRLKALLSVARVKPEMVQNELHPYLPQNQLLNFCTANRVHVTAYSPLGSPDRDPSLKAADEPALLEDPTIATLADGNRITPAQVLIGWAIQRGTAVIPKSVNPARIQQNLASADISLTEEDMQAIAGISVSRRYVTGQFLVIEGGHHTMEDIWDE